MTENQGKTACTTQIFQAPDPEGSGTHAIAFHVWGEPDAERTCVCVHGMTRNGRDFDYLAAALAGAGFRVICPDMPGRGDSPWLPNPAWYDNRHYAEDLAALLHHLGVSRCDWVGTSMGGIIGMILCATRPKLIARMVINDIGAVIPKEGMTRLATYVGVQTTFPDRTAYEAYLKRYLTEFGITSDAHVAHALAISADAHPDGTYTMRYDPALGASLRDGEGRPLPFEDIPLWEVWKLVKCPVLLLRGENTDILRRDTAEEMARMNGRTTLIEFPSIGHAPGLMDPEQIRLITDWLTSPDTKAVEPGLFDQLRGWIARKCA